MFQRRSRRIAVAGCFVAMMATAGCPPHVGGRISIPGFGNVEKEDICGDSPNCDVQGMNVQPLLDEGSSRRAVADPYSFIGTAFRPRQKNSLNGPVESCGILSPDDVATQTIEGTTRISSERSSEFKASLSASLARAFTGSAKAELDSLVTTTFAGEISFDRTIYTLKDGDAAARRNAECRKMICAQGRPCAAGDWSVVYSASIVTLSAQSVKAIREKIVAGIAANAELKKTVEAQVGVGAAIDESIERALTTSVKGYQFAAYVGYNQTLDAAASIAVNRPNATLACAGDSRWKVRTPGLYRFSIATLTAGSMSDASLCSEVEKTVPDCWRNFLGASGTTWEVNVPGAGTQLAVWAREGANASAAMRTNCIGGESSVATYSWDHGFSVAFKVERIE